MYDRHDIVGGKIRSFLSPDGTLSYCNMQTLVSLTVRFMTGYPAEHGFHFWSDFYNNVPSVWRQIPLAAPNTFVYDNAVVAIDPNNAMKTNARGVKDHIDHVVNRLKARGVPSPTIQELEFYAQRLLSYITSCPARKTNQLDQWSYSDYFMPGTGWSQGYIDLINEVNYMVACRPNVGSTDTLVKIGLQMMQGAVLYPNTPVDRYVVFVVRS